MTHDPFQTYSNFSQYGMPVPIGLQYPSLQNSAINPVTALNPLLGLSPMAQAGGIPQLGQSPYGPIPNQGLINQQQLQQLATLVATQPLLAASLLSNPLIAASLHSQALGLQQPSLFPQVGQVGSPFGQIGYPLAPQTWIGQGGPFAGNQGFGPVHPFQPQLSPRLFQGQGSSPWGY